MKKSLSIIFCAALIVSFNFTNLLAQIELEKTIPGRAARTFQIDQSISAPDYFMDYNGDGVPDPSFIAVDPSDPSGNTLYIQSGADPNQRWEVRIAENYDPGLAILIGFVDFDGDNLKEIILAEKKGQSYLNPIVVDVDGKVLWVGSGKRLLSIADVDGDDCSEIVASNPSVPQVEIWGEGK